MLSLDAVGASAADIAAARLGRSLKLWLDLQASVNGFIDSTTADKGVLVSRNHLQTSPRISISGLSGIWLVSWGVVCVLCCILA